MAAILTMIRERVVKPAPFAILARPNVRPAYAWLARFAALAFGILLTWGFARADHTQKSLEEISRVCSLQMAPVLTISTRSVVKTGAICNLGPGDHACQAKQRMKKAPSQ